MSKTPEEFAAEKCAERLYEMPQQFVKSLEYCLKKQMKTCYLAGYKAAQEHAYAALEEAEARIQELRDRLMEESGGRLKLFKDDADAKAAYQEALEDADSCKRVPDYDDEMRKYIKTRGKKGAFW